MYHDVFWWLTTKYQVSFMKDTEESRVQCFRVAFIWFKTKCWCFEGAFSPVFYPVVVIYGIVCSTHLPSSRNVATFSS